MRTIRPSGSEGGGASTRSPYPYPGPMKEAPAEIRTAFAPPLVRREAEHLRPHGCEKRRGEKFQALDNRKRARGLVPREAAALPAVVWR